jgi:hypothetical protein
LRVIAYAFWHSPAAGVPEEAYEAALAAFMGELSAAAVPGLRRCQSIRFEGLPWVAASPAYQDWYELDGTAVLDALEAGAVRAAMAAPHAAIARLAGIGSGGLFARRSDSERVPRASIGGARIAWVDKPAGTTYSSFIAGLLTAVEPGGELWQRRLSLGPGREFCLRLPEDGPSPGEVSAALPAGSLIVRGTIVASAGA